MEKRANEVSGAAAGTSAPLGSGLDRLAGQQKPIKEIVLVHGAFTDGSCWAKVIPLLEEMGYKTAAVQNPLLSLSQEVGSVKRMIARQEGPVLLVGHSWGGAVITEAGDDAKVAGLIYITGYAPDEGQSANDSSGPFGWTEGQKQIRVSDDGFATLSEEGMAANVTECLDDSEQRLAFVVQGQSYGPMFAEKLTTAAWKRKPCWALISDKDRMLPPAMEEACAKKMNAETMIVSSCHMVILEAPMKVAQFIDKAAKELGSAQN